MTPAHRPTRRGLTVVEAALVLTVFATFLFGLFEYSRFLMVLHVTNNAARDGARYAAVNLDKPTTFDATDHTDAAGNVFPSVKRYTTERMGGVNRQLDGFEVAVYPVDPVGLTLTPPVIRSKTTDTTDPIAYPDPFDPADPNRPTWNRASFPDRVAVTLRGTYRPATPVLLIMPSTIPVNITATLGSEG